MLILHQVFAHWMFERGVGQQSAECLAQLPVKGRQFGIPADQYGGCTARQLTAARLPIE
jgi:hypothetical protein